jgi:hypothetical protein
MAKHTKDALTDAAVKNAKAKDSPFMLRDGGGPMAGCRFLRAEVVETPDGVRQEREFIFAGCPKKGLTFS